MNNFQNINSTFFMRQILFVLFLFSFNFIFSQNGNRDSTFNFYAIHKRIIGNVNCVKVQGDNKIILGGSFYTSGSIFKSKLMRINEDKSLDTNFLAGNSINKPIKDIAIQTDGKIIIVGDFENFDGIAANGIIRLNIDGSVDPTFYLGIGALSTGGFDREVFRVRLQDDGKIIIAGNFDVFNGVNRRRIARLNIDGTLDNSFDPGIGVLDGMSLINDFVILPNQKIMIGGSFGHIDGYANSCSNMTRLNSNGSYDNTYVGDGTSNVINKMSFQGDKIIVVGAFDVLNNPSGSLFYYSPKIGRFNEDGVADLTFSSSLPAGGFDYLKGLYVYEDSTILVGSTYEGSLTKLNKNGDVLWSGDEGGIHLYGMSSLQIYSIDVNSFGKIVFGGNFNVSINQGNGNNDYFMSNGIGFMTKDGNRDLHVGGVGARNILYPHIEKTIGLPNDKMLICGNFLKFNNIYSTGLAKLESNGKIDTTFNVGTGFLLNGFPEGEIYSIANQADGKFIVGGYFTSYQGIPKSGLIRIGSNGNLDVNFASGINFGSFTPYAIRILEDGKYLIAGTGMITNISNGAYRKGIFRLNIDGTLDETFDIGLSNSVQLRTFDVQEDGKIICGGIFPSINSLPYRHLIRFNTNGSIDTTFNTMNQFGSPTATVEIKSINILPDGKILVGGNFQNYQNESRMNIMKLNEDASLDTTFIIGTGFNLYVNIINDQPDGKILVGGAFGMYNGNSTSSIVKLMANGNLDTNFIGPNNLYWVNHLHFQSSGKIIVSSGGSNDYYYLSESGLYRLNNDSFSPPMEIAINSSINLNCQSSGVATILPINGISPFLYSWDSLPISNNPDLIYFTPGIHYATIIDSTGASESMTVILNGPEIDTLHDLKGNLITSFYRPGVVTPIFLDWYNQTCDSVSGFMELILDSNLSLSTVTPIPDTIIGDTLRWNYSDLIYNQTHLTAQLEVLTSSNTTIGDSIKIAVKVYPIIGDSDSSDNIKNYIFPVINSYDPNDKKVYPLGDCIPHYIDSNELLTYTVRFQNTGTAEAINIFILDSIDVNLDLNSFKLVAQSHQLQVQVLSNNVLKFMFNNINLPDSSTNELESQGYVVFEILPINNLPNGTIISNDANIYFDYNPAIITNEVSSTISNGFYGNSTSNVYLNSCDSLNWNGQVIYTSGQYVEHLQNIFGCDSSVYLDVYMGFTKDTLLILSVCDSLLINSDTFYSSGTYSQVIQNSTGCDSNIVIDLTINENTFNNLYITELDSFNYEGVSYYASGIYYQIFQNYLGCDSTVSINLNLTYTGLLDNKFEEFLIYPNPTKDHINIRFQDLPIDTKYHISNEMGQIVKSAREIENQTQSIDISDLNSGVYFLVVDQKSKIIFVKIIKY